MTAAPLGAGFPYLDHPGPIPFAHRGGAGDWPENTMPAFEGAVRLGFRYVETDAHVTTDGVVVAFHDDRLDRVTDRTGAIAELSWPEVAAARVDGVEAIPRLDELFSTWPDLRVNIDPKHDAVVEPLADLIERAGVVDRVCIGAFSDRRIDRLRQRLGPGLCTAGGPRAVARLTGAAKGLPLGSLDHPCVQVPVRAKGVRLVDERFVRAAHRHGVAVHVWTIDDPEEMTALLDLGVDGIMTDRPAVLREVMAARGVWH